MLSISINSVENESRNNGMIRISPFSYYAFVLNTRRHRLGLSIELLGCIWQGRAKLHGRTYIWAAAKGVGFNPQSLQLVFEKVP